jgi:hypothetical protein
LLKKAHVINKNIDGFYAKTTQAEKKDKKNYDAILPKYDSAVKRYINYTYVLKNGVGRFTIFF